MKEAIFFGQIKISNLKEVFVHKPVILPQKSELAYSKQEHPCDGSNTLRHFGNLEEPFEERTILSASFEKQTKKFDRTPQACHGISLQFRDNLYLQNQAALFTVKSS